jgi:hypothetical protein
MTRVTQAASAMRMARAAPSSSPEPEAMTFLEQGSADPPPADLPARRQCESVTLRDRLDAERWLDEGGSFSSEAVTR